MNSIESLPLFPLADVVLLPGVSVPLRLFEPRYLQMARDVLAGSAQIGMVTVRPDSLADIAGDPPTFAIGCLGQISQAQEQRDGTFQILLLGQSRFRIVEEEQRDGDRLYRSARVELLADESPTAPEAQALLDRQRRDLFALLEKFVQRLRRGESVEHVISGFEGLEPAHLINSLTRSLALESIERQQLLEANSILSRFEIMCDLLRFRLAEVGGGESGSTGLPN
jgi:Lon protease-like protein